MIALQVFRQVWNSQKQMYKFFITALNFKDDNFFKLNISVTTLTHFILVTSQNINSFTYYTSLICTQLEFLHS